MPILRKALVLTAYYILKANDDQGDEQPARSITMRRELERTQYLPSVEEIDKAKNAAIDLVLAQLRFKHNGAFDITIRNITATVQFETY